MNPLVALAIIAAVALLALFLRRTSGDSATADPAGEKPAAEEVPVEEIEEEPEEEPDEEELEQLRQPIAMTAEGRIFGALDGRAFLVSVPKTRPVFEGGLATWEKLQRVVPTATRALRGAWGSGSALERWQFTGGRVAPAGGEAGGFRLELLGRDSEYSFHSFETARAAEAALAILRDTACIRVREDEDPPGDEVFEEARRAYEEAAIPDQVFALEPEPGPEQAGAPDEAGTEGGEGEVEAPPPPPLSPGQAAAQADTREPMPSPEGQEWLLERLRALLERAGIEPFVCAPILTPSDRHFPDLWAPDSAAAQRVAGRLLGYARLADHRALIELADDDDAEPVTFGGVRDEICLFTVARHALGEPGEVANALARETARAWRVVKGLVDADPGVEGALVDLTAVYLGFGILVANAAMTGSAADSDALSPQSTSFLLAAQAVACSIEPHLVAKWLEPTQAEFFAKSFEDLETRRDELDQRLGLPPEDQWPEPWGAKG